MRRLLVLVCVLVGVDTMLFAALTPLLPHLAHQLGLSTGSAGVLVAAYAAGALIGGLPGGVAAVKLGPRRAVLAGLTMMGIASLAFALAGDFETLFVARIAQGAGSAFTWAGAFAWLLAVAPRAKRGEVIGTALGAAVFGALFGPVVGAIAAVAGRTSVFSALAAVAIVLIALTLRLESPTSDEEPSVGALRRALIDSPLFSGGLVLMVLASVLAGIISVLAPLHLAAAGWGATAIGAVWLVGAAVETVQSPLVGRLSDRRGALVPVRYAMSAGVVTSAALALGGAAPLYALFVVLASLTYGALFTPAFALIADGAEHAGLAQGMAFGMMNAAWALGAVVGPAAGGAIAQATGDEIPFLIAAAICLLLLLAVRGRSLAPAATATATAASSGEASAEPAASSAG
ncbi:MAG TPA: MFS transporter [Solirubrobacteraceae bacterium]|jgi:MFS family permease